MTRLESALKSGKKEVRFRARERFARPSDAAREHSVYRTPSSGISDIFERQRTGTRAVDVGKAVLLRQTGCHQHLSSVTKHIRIRCEGSDGASDELGGFGIAQVEPLGRFHH